MVSQACAGPVADSLLALDTYSMCSGTCVNEYFFQCSPGPYLFLRGLALLRVLSAHNLNDCSIRSDCKVWKDPPRKADDLDCGVLGILCAG
jgi:hypothetical protein